MFTVQFIYSADLFQSSSVLAYSCNPPMPSCRLQPHTILQNASYYAAGCRIQPTLYHLKGVSLICHRLPQAATGCHRAAQPRAPPAPASPSNIPKSVLPPAQEC